MRGKYLTNMALQLADHTIPYHTKPVIWLKINVRESWSGNHEWTFRRHWQKNLRKNKKTKTIKNTETKTSSNTNPIKNRSGYRCLSGISSSCFLKDTRHVTHIIVHHHYTQYKNNTIKAWTTWKQLGVKRYRTSFLCGKSNRHYNTDLRT